MINDQNIENVAESDGSENVALSILTNTVSELVAGTTIPAPIRKNVFKAFDRLCSAAIDWPVSWFEGKSSEKRAETQARIKLIATTGDQIARKMDVDAVYADVAERKYGERVLREQLNLDRTCEVAANEIANEIETSTLRLEGVSDESNEIPLVDDDWLNSFEKEASLKSTEDMQLLFGRILAGEIQRPTSFSIKTVKLLANLDNLAAKKFQRLCSLCVSIGPNDKIFDARVVSLGGNASTNSLLDYGLSFDDLNMLHEYGLLISDYNSYRDYRYCVADKNNRVSIGFKYQNKDWGFLPFNERTNEQELRIHGVAPSRSGKELLGIVDIEIDEKYTSALQEYFYKQNLKMVEIPDK